MVNIMETYRTHRNMVVNMRRDCERTFLRVCVSVCDDFKMHNIVNSQYIATSWEGRYPQRYVGIEI